MSKPETLRFGIQSLDQLIGTVTLANEQSTYGIDLCESRDFEGACTSPDIASSVCLTGPDGTGKSVFSLHMASRYLADCLDDQNLHSPPDLLSPPPMLDQLSTPKVLYISTDLTYEMALKSWSNFALDCPFGRREPLVELKEGRKTRQGPGVRLQQYYPSGDSEKSIVNYLEGSGFENQVNGNEPEVCFVDLASRTAGDDWGFVHRLLSGLEQPTESQPRHLVVLDAIEGFETLVGDLNAFGQKTSRRSRIAQVMRLAAGKCHLVFVIEESRDERLPEEFVTDVVIRLRNVRIPRYLRRTVEIEKARGQWHIRGQHPFVIRDGKKGSTTGGQSNADDPEVNMGESWDKRFQSYVHVFPSLDYLSRETMIDKKEHNPSPDLREEENLFAEFGITYLDNMLGRRPGVRKNDPEVASQSLAGSGKPLLGDPTGLPCRSVTALIGDPLTQKSQLGRAFLSRGFLPYAEALADRIKTRQRTKKIRVDPQFAVMFTSQILDTVESVTNDCYKWVESAGNSLNETEKKTFEKHLKKYIARNMICRRFEIHDIPGPILMHIFQRNIERAQRMLSHKLHKTYPDENRPNGVPCRWRCSGGCKHKRYPRIHSSDCLSDPAVRYDQSWRIRVVIDDLNGFRNTFPEIRDDPLMLPMLLFLLNREGVTTLLIDTQTSGSPELSITERFDSSVRELVQHRIYTWRVPFYGENRVAITLIPPLSGEYRGIIRELRWETREDPGVPLSAMVDPNFELYLGLEQGKPQPIPLEVRLFAETPTFKRYIETEERLFREVFLPVPSSDGPEKSRVIIWAEASEYDFLRDSSHLQRDTRIEHTSLLQVDEYWWLRRAKQRRTGAFRSQGNYLGAVTSRKVDDRFVADLVVDPFEVFQPPTPTEPRKPASPAAANSAASPPPQATPESVVAGEKPPAQERKRRLDFFDELCGYDLSELDELEAEGEEDCMDRVPFTWDFGFLLCNESAWEEAAELDIGKRRDDSAESVLFQAEDLVNPTRLTSKLKTKTDPVSKYLVETKEIDVSKWQISGGRITKADEGKLLAELNRLLDDESLHQEGAFAGIRFSDETRELLRERPEGDLLRRFNRLLLEDAYPDEIARHRPKVKHVWERLRKVSRNSRRQAPVTWREFLAAGKVVAEFQSYRTSTPTTAFDFTMLMPEAFSCLILEMWVSEIYDSLSRRAEVTGNNDFVETRDGLLDRLRRRRWRWKTGNTDDKNVRDPKNLLVALMNEKSVPLETILDRRLDDGKKNPRNHLGGYSLELYKVWLLLVETLNFSELVDSSSHLNFEFKSRDTTPQAVAARHWYKTASKFIDSLTPEQLENNWVPVRLPGHFSVRADWFLAVAGGSRSSRLADHALDLLSSKRANVTRLQEGIGLPTRKLFAEDADLSHLRTRLISIPEPGRPLANVEYDRLREIGASSLFFPSDITDPRRLMDELSRPTDPESVKGRMSLYLMKNVISPASRELMSQLNRRMPAAGSTRQSAHAKPSSDEKLREEAALHALVKDLNKALSGPSSLFAAAKLTITDDQSALSAETRRMLHQPHAQGLDLVLLNRMVLEDIYLDETITNRFHWLWRSGIWAYNRHSRIWQKWLNRTLLWWHSLRQRYGSNWTSGFDVYDLITEIESGKTELTKELTGLQLESWKYFHEIRDILIAELEQVTTRRPRRSVDNPN